MSAFRVLGKTVKMIVEMMLETKFQPLPHTPELTHGVKICRLLLITDRLIRKFEQGIVGIIEHTLQQDRQILDRYLPRLVQ